ncbi:MAG TPA: 2OG-Fe(II) oxygenase [Dongiaceae bacterium]|jgi:hypothetical protein|nr:2OG-Fe(II) oxygenase [Dongiaceae bacterium]
MTRVGTQISILACSRADDVQSDPFSHLVRNGCLPAETYRHLAAAFPSTDTILGGREARLVNAAARLPAFKVLDNAAIAPTWRDFFAFHTSDGFWKDIVRVFGSALRATHPDLERQAGKALDAWCAGPRGASSDFDVQLDCQFVVNTPWPVGKAGSHRQFSVKTAHVDKRDTILSALLYFRDPDDQGAGGDLELYAWNREPRFLKPRVILPSDIERREQVPYAANTLVAFVNSPKAAHGVTPRAPSPLPRRYVNFIAEVPFTVFDTTMLGPLQRLLHWPGRWRRLGSRDIGGDRY